jgi:hypothetical protein
VADKKENPLHIIFFVFTGIYLSFLKLIHVFSIYVTRGVHYYQLQTIYTKQCVGHICERIFLNNKMISLPDEKQKVLFTRTKLMDEFVWCHFNKCS